MNTVANSEGAADLKWVAQPGDVTDIGDEFLPFAQIFIFGIESPAPIGSLDDENVSTLKAAAMLPDLLGPQAIPLDLHFTLPSGEDAVSAQLLLVSNNPYAVARLRGGGTRERLDDGVLGIAFVRVDTAAEAETLAALEVAGRARHFARWNEWTAAEFEVRSSRPVEVGVDGEALTLQPPLHFVSRPSALTVYPVPRRDGPRPQGP